MSTTTGSANSARYVDFDEYVDLKLQKTRSTIKSTDLLVALAGVAAMFLGYLLAFVVFDQWVVPGGFGVGLRWMLLLTLLSATIAWLVCKVGMPYLRSVNRLYAAREIEKSDPSLKSNLLNLVDLRASGRDISPSVMRTLERHAAVQLQQIDVTQAIDHRPLMRTASVLLAVIVMFCLYALFSPKDISNSIWRGLLPTSELALSTSTEILNVLPGDVTVVARTANARVEIIADLGGLIPEKVFVHFTTSDGKFRDEPVELRADAEGQTRFKGMLVGETGQGLLQDTTYVVRAGDAESKAFHITVEQPPSATPDKVRLAFPGYMKLEPTEQPGGQIDSWEGVKVTLTAHTNVPVKSATIQFLDEPTAAPTGDDLPMTVAGDGRHLDATWTLAFRSVGTSYSKHYRIQCKTATGAEDPAPIVYGISIRPDLPPEIALLEPVRDLEAPANATIPLLIQARDPDFELSHINLHVEKAGQSILKDSLSDTKQPRALLKHDLVLDRLTLRTGDVIEFWIEAFDNKQPRSNRKNTPRLKVTIVDPISDKAARQQLAEDKKQRDRRLAEAQQEQNGDGSPNQPPQEEVSANDPPREPKPNEQPNREPMPREPVARERDPMPQENAQPSKDNTPGKDGQPGADGQGNNPPKDNKPNEKSPRDPVTGSKSPGTADGKDQNSAKDGTKKNKDDTKTDGSGAKQKDSNNGTNSDKREPSTPLSPDGADDEKVLEKLINKLKPRDDDEQQNASKKDDPAHDSKATREPKSKDEQPKPEPGSPDSKPEDDKDEQSPAKPKDSKTKDTPSEKPPTKPPSSNEATPKDETGVGKDSQVPMPKSDGSKIKPSSPEKTNTDKKDTDKTKPGEPSAKPNDPEKNGPGSKESPQPEEPAPNQNDTKGPKKTETPKENGPKNNETGKTPMPGDKSDMPDETSTPDKNSPDKPSPDKNSDNKRPGNVEKDAPSSPPSKQTDDKQPGKPDPKSTPETTPDFRDGKQPPKNDPEQGPPKPQPDSKAKPTPQPSQDPQRDSKDKPMPGDKQPNAAPSSPNDSSSDKPGDKQPGKKPPQPGKSPSDATGDKQPADPAEQPKPEQSTTKKDNNSPTADEPQPPANKKNQRTNDANNGGETGGDKPDKTGKPSQQQGPGAPDKKPGDKQSSDSKQQSPDKQKQPAPGSKTDKDGKPQTGDSKDDGKPSDSTDGKPADGKPSSKNDKPGAEGKPSNEPAQPGDHKPGDPGAGKDSPEGKSKQSQPDQPAGPESKSDSPKSDSPPGQPGKDAKPGDKGGDKPGDKSGEGKGEGKSPGGKPSDKPGKGSGKPGGKLPAQGGGSANPGAGGELPEAGDGPPAAPLEEEAANLEYNKQATELVLKRLQKELERGDVDPELLEQLGWTEAEMKRFAERLGKHLEQSNPNDETPESVARREQFEEMLKSLDLKKRGTKRTGENSPQREVNQIESRRTNVPPTYKRAFEQFTKDVARQKSPKQATLPK